MGPLIVQENSMNLWKKAGVNPNKLVMLIPFYSQTYQLTNPENSVVRAATVGLGHAGRYTKINGTLAYYEVI